MSYLASLVEHLIHSLNILLKLPSAGADRGKLLFQNGYEQLFALNVAKATASVVLLKLVKRGILRKVLCKMLRLAEGVELCKDTVALHLARV